MKEWMLAVGMSLVSKGVDCGTRHPAGRMSCPCRGWCWPAGIVGLKSASWDKGNFHWPSPLVQIGTELGEEVAVAQHICIKGG